MIQPKHIQTPSKLNQDETEPEEIVLNPLTEIYLAAKRALLTISKIPGDELSPPYFKHIAIDTGQFQRIIRNENLEMEIPFPACFIHFINVRYLVQQQRIGEGRATMRIRFVLNTLNNSDPERECEAFDVFQAVNIAIQDAKDREPALTERCNLSYFDMPTTSNMLQAYWVDYDVWFRELSAWKYRDWVKKYLVIPPFTNHTDAPEHDTEQHGNHKEPAYPDVSGYVDVDGSEVDDQEEGE